MADTMKWVAENDPSGTGARAVVRVRGQRSRHPRTKAMEEYMKLSPGRVLALLAAVMVVQVGIVTAGMLSVGQGTTSAVLSIGDTLRFLASPRADGKPISVQLATRTGAVTVLYAFHSECVHSLEVAPKWAVHFAEEQPAEGRSDASETRRIAVTRENQEVANAHAQRFGWSVPATSLLDAASNTRARRDIHASLLSRTPWVFVFDSDGVLRYHGHGADLEGLARSVRALQRSATDQPGYSDAEPATRSTDDD